MTTSYLPYDPQQQMLLPYALQEWLPEGHLAYYISDTVDALDLSAFHARYAGGGPRNQPFHPGMMVKVLLYAYATGVFSSRKIARKLHEDVAFRVLGQAISRSIGPCATFAACTCRNWRRCLCKWSNWRANADWLSWAPLPSTAPRSRHRHRAIRQ